MSVSPSVYRRRIAKNTLLEELVRSRTHAHHSLQYQLQTDRRVRGSVAGRNIAPSDQPEAPTAALKLEAIELLQGPVIAERVVVSTDKIPFLR